MSRHNSGPRRDPFLFRCDRHSEPSTLHEAKLAAWAFAIGEGAPHDEGRSRRPHRGLLPDLPVPEPPRRVKRSWLGRLADAIGRVLQPAWASEAHTAMLLQDTFDSAQAGAGITHIGRNHQIGAAASRGPDDDRPIRSHAA